MSDNTSDWLGIQKRVEALGVYRESVAATKELTKRGTDSLSESFGQTASKLGDIQNQSRRFQKNIPTSTDQMLNLLSKTRGDGNAALKYLRKKVLETALSMESKLQEIVIDETIKVLGCSQEQSYNGIHLPSINPIPFISSLPVQSGIYIPVNSIDFLGNLKINPNTIAGKYFYEKYEPSTDSIFKPYGGIVNYPFNKMLNLKMNNTLTYSNEYGGFYNGISGQKLFDISYTNTNSLGLSGDYFRVFLIDRDGSNTNGLNNSNNRVGQFLKDYYSTINLIDPVTLVGSLMNYATGFVNIEVGMTYRDLNNQSKFDRILTRILGLCQDKRTEIDIAGTAKVPELDVVDDSFFEFTDVELRNIENQINNIQLGLAEFEDCGNLKLPIDSSTLIAEIANFRDELSGNTQQQNLEQIEKIIDSFSENPNWKPLIPSNIQINASVNKGIIKNLPKAIAAGVLTPKVLLPIFVMLSSIEQSAINAANSPISLVNSQSQNVNNTLQSGSTIGQQVNNIITDGVDFLKKFKTFVLSCVSKINSEFLRTLFQILKKDILNLLNVAILEIKKSGKNKLVRIILRLVQLGVMVLGLGFSSDYRKCKNLIDDILKLLDLINSTYFSGGKIPTPLLFLTQLLPGYSSERAEINTIEIMRTLGLPTGPLPDGTPNLMVPFLGAILKGSDKEESENGTVDSAVLVPPITGGLLRVYAKKR